MNEQQFIASACVRASQAINSLMQVTTKLKPQQPEDEADQQEILQDCSSILFLITHIMDLNRGLTKPRTVERFFNVVGDDIVEVPREEFTGSLDDEDLEMVE